MSATAILSKTERTELASIVRMRAKLAKRDIESRKSTLLADVESQLSATYEFEEERWNEVAEAAERAVKEADAVVAKACEAAGVPAQFRPQLQAQWYSRGENAARERRALLRRTAIARIDAMANAAKLEVDRAETDLRIEIAATALTSAEAKVWLARLPTVEGLMPKLALAELENAEPRRLEP